MDIFKEYLRIMQGEMSLAGPGKRNPIVYDMMYFRDLARRVLEIALSSTKLRCCGPIGHLTDAKVAFESVGAHTNLMSAIVDYALDYVYGHDVIPMRYSRRDMLEAVRMHDLPENITGDTPDNSTRDEKQKDKEDTEYFEFYNELQPRDVRYHNGTLRILKEMQEKSSPEGKMIYTADKLAAIIMNLCYDSCGMSPIAGFNEPTISARNQEAMEMCDNVIEPGFYYLSEVWTIDFLVQRKIVQYDETGFFTALLVMTTLLCHDGKWYSWRERQY